MKRIILNFTVILCAVGVAAALEKTTEDSYDVVIRQAMVFDGSGSPAVRADVAVKDGLIVEIGADIAASAGRLIDGEGLYLTPGFIDLHTHADRGMYFRENRACLNYLTQGVTSLVVGQCGSSAWPIHERAEDQIKRWTDEGIGPNAALLVGHGTVRELVLGMENRAPTGEELERMKALVDEAMTQGVVGLSTGLIYLPGRYARTDEVVELVKIVAAHGGIYHSHIRDERDKLLEAVREAIFIAETTGIPTHISHFKVMGKTNWGLVREACALIEEARARGLKITADQYPYRFANGNPYRSLIPRRLWAGDSEADSLRNSDITAVFAKLDTAQLLDLYRKVTPYSPISDRLSDHLANLSRDQLVDLVGDTLMDTAGFRGPQNARERAMFLRRMENPGEAENIRRGIEAAMGELVGPENILVAVCVEKNLEGRTLAEIAEMKGSSLADTAIHLELMGAKCIPLQMCEEDIEHIMKKEYVGTGSDGTVPFYGIGLPHIRSYSTFLHKIKKYALERESVSLAHVIRSQTALPAEIMNWADRGLIRKGFKADIVVLDLQKLADKSSVSNPHQYSGGVKYLLINGKIVLDDGRWTGDLPGEILVQQRLK